MTTPSDRTADARGAVLFDIDGTLVDSNYLHVEAWSHAFAEAGAAVDDWRIHRCIGMDSGKLLGTLLGDDPEAVGSDAKRLHSQFYAELRPRLKPFPAARELLADLEQRRVAVVLATSAPEEELAALRDVLKVEATITDVTSADDVETAKPEPDVVHSALEKAGAAASESFLVGDTVWDVEAATRAGVRCIAVLSGGVSAAELHTAGAIAVYDDVAQLRDELEQSPLAALWS